MKSRDVRRTPVRNKCSPLRYEMIWGLSKVGRCRRKVPGTDEEGKPERCQRSWNWPGRRGLLIEHELSRTQREPEALGGVQNGKCASCVLPVGTWSKGTMTKKHKHSKSFGSTIQRLATWGKVGDVSESGGLGLKFGTFALHFRAGVGQAKRAHDGRH